MATFTEALAAASFGSDLVGSATLGSPASVKSPWAAAASGCHGSNTELLWDPVNDTLFINDATRGSSPPSSSAALVNTDENRDVEALLDFKMEDPVASMLSSPSMSVKDPVAGMLSSPSMSGSAISSPCATTPATSISGASPAQRKRASNLHIVTKTQNEQHQDFNLNSIFRERLTDHAQLMQSPPMPHRHNPYEYTISPWARPHPAYHHPPACSCHPHPMTPMSAPVLSHCGYPGYPGSPYAGSGAVYAGIHPATAPMSVFYPSGPTRSAFFDDYAPSAPIRSMQPEPESVATNIALQPSPSAEEVRRSQNLLKLAHLESKSSANYDGSISDGSASPRSIETPIQRRHSINATVLPSPPCDSLRGTRKNSSSTVTKRRASVIGLVTPPTPVGTTSATSPNGKRMYTCPYEDCGRSFPRQYNLKSHIFCHTGERPHVCAHCKAAFARKHDLQRHIRTLHANDRPFKCEHCSQGFQRADLLARHRALEEQAAAAVKAGRRIALPRHMTERCRLHLGASKMEGVEEDVDFEAEVEEEGRQID